jgi:hypothetical protein
MLNCKSVPGGWQSHVIKTGRLFGPIFNKCTDLWDWQATDPDFNKTLRLLEWAGNNENL